MHRDNEDPGLQADPDWPSSPDRRTGTAVAARRLLASFQPTSEGSTAATWVTADG